MGHRCAAGKWNRVISFGSRSAQWKMVRGRNLRLNVATENWELIFIKKAVLSSRFSVLSNGFAENLMYIEFHARSAFSFLEGASLPESLIETCANLGMPAMALLDRDGVYGAPRFYMAAKRAGIKAHIGAEINCENFSIRNCQFDSKFLSRELGTRNRKSKIVFAFPYWFPHVPAIRISAA